MPTSARLLNAFLDDPEIARRYRVAPAAKQIHHAFLSGLLEHVLSLCRLSKAGCAALPVHRLRPADRRLRAARSSARSTS